MTEGSKLRQSAQQAAESLRSPSRSSGLGPAHSGQEVQDQFLHSLNTAGRLQGRPVCGTGTRRETGQRQNRFSLEKDKGVRLCLTAAREKVNLIY